MIFLRRVAPHNKLGLGALRHFNQNVLEDLKVLQMRGVAGTPSASISTFGTVSIIQNLERAEAGVTQQLTTVSCIITARSTGLEVPVVSRELSGPYYEVHMSSITIYLCVVLELESAMNLSRKIIQRAYSIQAYNQLARTQRSRP